MTCLHLTARAAAALLFTSLLIGSVGASSRFVMPWMCLEDCGANASSITSQLAQLSTPGIFTSAAFEDYDLCSNGTACKKSYRSRVSDRVAALGLGSVAMVVSWDLDAIRASFAAPALFISSLNMILDNEPALTGINLDFEPHGSNPPVGPVPTADDALAFAILLNITADALHSRTPSVLLSADIATWTKFWDYSVLDHTRVDYLCDMESYNADFAFFQNQVTFAMSHISPEKYVCGLSTTHESGPNQGKPFNTSELEWRFDFLKSKGVQKIAMWDTPLPLLWMPFLKAFVEDATPR